MSGGEDGDSQFRGNDESSAARLAVVAHELRGPLDAVSLAVALLERETAALPEVSTHAARLFERLKRNLGLISRLVADLVEKSRLDVGGVPLHRAPVSLVEMVTDVVASLDEPSRARVSLAAREPVVVLADGERLIQVLINLIRNALQHGAGPVAVTVSGGPAGGILSVENPGELPAGVVDRIFEPFTRGTEKGVGLGLGLYIVKKLVDAHSGTIAVSANEGRVIFTITLPAAAG